MTGPSSSNLRPFETAAGSTKRIPVASQSVSLGIGIQEGSRPNEAPQGAYHLYTRRWTMLVVFSFCSFVNNVISFSFSPVSGIASELYGGRSRVSSLVQSFFVTYALSSVPATSLVASLGLKASVRGAAWLQFTGCMIRWVFWNSYRGVLCGQVVASLAQAVFVNSPPEVSLVWFGAHERTFATTISVNANSLGIAGAYLLALICVPNDSIDEIPTLLATSTFLSGSGAILTSCLFEEEPPVPPTKAAEVRRRLVAEHEENDEGDDTSSDVLLTRSLTPIPAARGVLRRSLRKLWSSAKRITRLLGTDLKILGQSLKEPFERCGFIQLVIAFSFSEALINSFSSDLSDFFIQRGLDRGAVSVAGCGFILCCLLGSAVLSPVVDSTKLYKAMLLLSLVGSSLSCAVLAIPNSPTMTVIGVLLVGFWCGPIQPITIEAAAEVIFPLSENLSTAVMQVTGNLLSAAVVPAFDWAAENETLGWYLCFALLGVTACAVTFDGQLRRLGLEFETPLIASRREGFDSLAFTAPMMMGFEGLPLPPPPLSFPAAVREEARSRQLLLSLSSSRRFLSHLEFADAPCPPPSFPQQSCCVLRLHSGGAGTGGAPQRFDWDTERDDGTHRADSPRNVFAAYCTRNDRCLSLEAPADPFTAAGAFPSTPEATATLPKRDMCGARDSDSLTTATSPVASQADPPSASRER